MNFEKIIAPIAEIFFRSKGEGRISDFRTIK